ncbi:hypothetical protein A33M_1357 [Rhodovulum sp. PH10]|nr:hypothetical protein A33M_1357 [Rhodovulum sp. PH10]
MTTGDRPRKRLPAAVPPQPLADDLQPHRSPLSARSVR